MSIMESNRALVETLCSLCQYDIDAVYAYEQVLGNIDTADVHQRLTQFREDHERHVLELSSVIFGFGGTPPTVNRDLKGFLMEGYSLLRSPTGTEGALKAMRFGEIMTNRAYADAMTMELSAELRQMLEANREDERRHLDYIETTLEEISERSRRAQATAGTQPSAHF